MCQEDTRIADLLSRQVKQHASNPHRSSALDSQKDVQDFRRSKSRAGTAPVGCVRTGGAVSSSGGIAAAEAAAEAERAQRMRLSAQLLARKSAMRLRTEAQQRMDKVRKGR